MLCEQVHATRRTLRLEVPVVQLFLHNDGTFGKALTI
jgi:hypothetical protein